MGLMAMGVAVNPYEPEVLFAGKDPDGAERRLPHTPMVSELWGGETIYTGTGTEFTIS
jgi:hypothetical protein